MALVVDAGAGVSLGSLLVGELFGHLGRERPAAVSSDGDGCRLDGNPEQRVDRVAVDAEGDRPLPFGTRSTNRRTRQAALSGPRSASTKMGVFKTSTPDTGGREEASEGSHANPSAEAADLADVDFPAGHDRDECEAADYAARDYLREHGSASMREIVTAVMPTHSLSYDVPT